MGRRGSDQQPERLEPRLQKAVEADDVGEVRRLIEQARARDDYNRDYKVYRKFLTVGLNRACDKNLVEVARALLASGADPDPDPKTSGNKPASLLRAAEYGLCEIAETLIAHKANIEVQDKKGRTALMTSAWKGQYDVVKLLLAKGACVDTADSRGRNVMHNLASDKGADKTPESKPSRKWGPDIVHHLLQAGVNLEARDCIGRTPLHWTCVTNQPDLMKTLLTSRFHGAAPRADVHARDNREKSALHLAASHNNETLVNLLLEHGANVHARSDGGWTALHNACNSGSGKLVEMLLDAHADVNSELLNGRTPLHVAAQFGNKDAAGCLLKRKRCRRNAKDRFGITPLLMAAENGKREIVEMLAPWNHLGDLSADELEASRRATATVLDFGNYKNENRVLRPSVHEVLYGRETKDDTKHTISTLSKNIKGSNFRWIHLPANNLVWCDALLTKRFIEEGATDIEGYKALESSFSHQHKGQQQHSRFMRPMCQVIHRGTQDHGEGTLVEKAGPPTSAIPDPAHLTAVPESMQEHRSPDPSGVDRVSQRDEQQATSGADRSRKQRSKSGKPVVQRQNTSSTTTTSDSLSTTAASMRTAKTHVQRQGTSSTAAASEGPTALGEDIKVPETTARASPKPSKKSTPRKESRASIDKTDKSSTKVTAGRPCNVFMFMPYLHFETDDRRKEMQAALNNPRSLYRYEVSADELLIRAHLEKSSSFLHIRRTLDQFFYHNIDTQIRDCDQVVYRFQQNQQKHRNDPEHVAKVFMVDQLWLWIIGKDLVVTSFPQRWRQPRNDPLNVLDGIIEDINSKTREPVQNVYELAMTITGRCYGTFDRHRKGDDDFQFFDMFEASIGAAMNHEATLFQEFSRASKKASQWLQSHQRPNRFSRNLEADTKAHLHAARKTDRLQTDDEAMETDPQFVDQLLDVGSETDLLAEIKDIRDELDIIGMVLEHQKSLLPDLKSAIKSVYYAERSLGQVRKVDKVFEEQEKTIGNPIKDIMRMDAQANRIYVSIRDLLDLKQKHANAFEARFARDQAAGTRRQGMTLQVFTIATVVFLPLSFIASFFAINVESFPHDPRTGQPQMSLGYVSQYIFGIGLAISIPCITIALSVDELGYIVSGARRRLRQSWLRWRAKKDPGAELELQSLKIEQTLSVAKTMRRSMDTAWNGKPRGGPPRMSSESAYHVEEGYGRAQGRAWDQT